MSSHVLLDNLDLDFLEVGNIVEIGSSRERARSAVTSTYYFRDLTRELDTNFYSVDFAETSFKLATDILAKDKKRCTAICQDGKSFIDKYRTEISSPISLLYLDNFDVIYSPEHELGLLQRARHDYEVAGEDISNKRSAEVHLEQMMTALPIMARRSVVICDDTLLQDGEWWGKGALVVPELLRRRWKLEAVTENGCMLVSPSFHSSLAKYSQRRKLKKSKNLQGQRR